MELRTLKIKGYKGYAQPTELDLAPLTILVGPNNSGKTALGRAIQLLAGGLAPEDKDTQEPLPLNSGGIKHGDTFADLVYGRSVHGRMSLSATLMDDGGELCLSAMVQDVMTPTRPPTRQILNWGFASGGSEIWLERQDLDVGSGYAVTVGDSAPQSRRLSWRGLIPSQLNDLADWTETRIDALQRWASGVRYLQCPRSIDPTPFTAPGDAPSFLGPHGGNTPLALATNDDLRESVRKWYRETLGTAIDIVAQGRFFELVVESPVHASSVSLSQSGRGLSQALPVVVMAMTAKTAGPGVDIIEQPEAELHPAVHAGVAELLLDNLSGPARPLIVETHSEMVLLRARRWVAEGRLPADDVVIYWICSESASGSCLQKIKVNDQGELDSWPAGVFIEDYSEIMAIRRAARAKKMG